MTTQPENILIVDDTQANLKILSLMLLKHKYRVHTALDGLKALQLVQESPPDIIILDIMMPGMGGYEVCQKLKNDEQTKDIPVIFISALSSASDKVKAFEVGGVDYITKPFQIQEVLARVKNHLMIRHLQNELQKANNELGKRVEERTTALIKVNASLQQQIFERHRIEESLRNSEEIYRTLFEDSKDTVFIFTPDGQVVDINPAGLQLFGYTEREVITINANHLYATPEHYDRFWQEIEIANAVKDFEIKLKRKDSSQMDCLVTATLRRADDGKILAYQGIIRNITERKQAERERLLLLSIQRELGIAQEIQESLLPPPEPEWSDLEIICYNTPAREMGGDLYAYHAFSQSHYSEGSSCEERKYVIAVGDVSGKGMPAALLMAVSLASFRSIVAQELSSSEFLVRMDNALLDYTKRSHQNCALVYLEITPPSNNEESYLLRAANAGCVTPIIKRASGVVEWIEVGGMPLGIGLGSQTGYDEVCLNLFKGDFIILTSDGVIEANNEIGELFSFDRLEEAVRTGPQKGAEDMLEHLINEVAEFVGYTEPHDDMTIVVVQI
jgi:PAS domain S-box-containing protein